VTETDGSKDNSVILNLYTLDVWFNCLLWNEITVSEERLTDSEISIVNDINFAYYLEVDDTLVFTISTLVGVITVEDPCIFNIIERFKKDWRCQFTDFKIAVVVDPSTNAEISENIYS